MTTAIYLRISSEDVDLKTGEKDESESISNQRRLLRDYVSAHADLSGSEILEFCDDGWSGTNFERPAIKELLEQIKRGKINCIVVKDLSRFGRDYITVGDYISRVFPFLGVRFISVNDGFDSINPQDIDSLDTSFRTLIYDLYSRDLSRKVRSARKARAERGAFLSPIRSLWVYKRPGGQESSACGRGSCLRDSAHFSKSGGRAKDMGNRRRAQWRRCYFSEKLQD